MKLLFTAFAFLLICIPALPQQDHRALPEDNLSYPVLITLGNGASGSGFYVNTPSAMFLVTAKHVLFDENTGNLLDTKFELLSYSKDLSDNTPNKFSVDANGLRDNKIVKHPSQDIAILKIASVSSEGGLAVMSIPAGITPESSSRNRTVQGVAFEGIKKLDQVLVGNQVVLLGYPRSLALQSMPEIDPLRPLLRKGIVAGVNSSTHSIILDCPAYFGNSGGPVIEVDPTGFSASTYKIIGVVTKFVPYLDGGRTFQIMANSGYSVAIPMDYVLELIK
jgi:Trypsin-like peptidase domain